MDSNYVSLFTKVSKGALWTTFANIISRGTYFVSAIVLSRILEPRDFGLFAFAMAIVTFLQGITQTGFDSALIQRQEYPEKYLNTAWTFELLRSLALFLLIFATAPLIGSFLDDERVVPVLRAVSFSLVFWGLRNNAVIFFRKNFDFRKQFILDVLPILGNMVVALMLAFLWKNVWALIIGIIVQFITMCLISYLLHPYRPKFEFNVHKAKSLFNFGKWILSTAIIVMIREQGLNIFVGKYLGMDMLGFFNRAKIFSTNIFQQFVNITWSVGYPAYAHIQNDKNRLKKNYIESLKIMYVIGIPLAGVMFFLSKDFIRIFLTDKWLPISPLIQFLCIQSILNIISTPAFILYQAIGRPDIGAKISAFGVFILGVIILPFSYIWGIKGVVIALFLSSLVSEPFMCILATRITNNDARDIIYPLVLSLLGLIPMYITIFIVKNYIFVGLTVISFLFSALSGVCIFLFTIYLFQKLTGYDIIETPKKILLISLR